MEVKRDILWRVYLSFLGIVVLGLVILGKAIYIQRVEGSQWIAMAQKQQQRIIDIDADRGTIYSEDGSMLSTSIPFFDIYIDFGADGLQEKNGKRFRENLDSLSLGLSRTFKDLSTQEYKRKLQQGFRKKDRYYLLKRNISFQQFKELRNLPLVRQGKNRSGFIAEVRNKRLNPFGLLANRTIGLSREFIGTDGSTRNTNVGLEMTYDSVLKGETGKRLVRFIAGGVYVPVEGAEVDPEHGKDVITTLDVNIQDIAENALLRMMQENECVHGTCIVMEVKTGKIKAIANLGRNKEGNYWEDLNYAIQRSEPGSTFKLATMLALLEDHKVTLNTQVNLEKGSWKYSNRTVYDSEQHGRELVTVKQAFEYSSNVAMAKLVTAHYGGNPLGFINHLNRLRLNVKSGISLVGESYPAVKTPKSKTWSKTSLPWMSFGYEVLVSPLQTLMLYNSVANGGKMMKPYLVNSILRSGLVVKQFEPEILEQSICSESTLKALKLSLEGVCAEEEGTGYKLFQSALYKVAGKTGTALVANGNRGYSDHIYQSSFAGYFPAGNPKYSCIVVIRNKPFAKKFYGAAVAGPVFKEVADKLYALDTNEQKQEDNRTITADSSSFYYAGNYHDMIQVMDVLKVRFVDSSKKSDYSKMYSVDYKPVISEQPVVKSQMPDVRGMGLKDALFLLEDIGLNVQVKGRGKVSGQSLAPGLVINKKQQVLLELN
ncbi:MAG TPA: penicillin-binding protein [Flavitalea sp.]|nr:penicillin-binding protein [Flavitalea sp.]